MGSYPNGNGAAPMALDGASPSSMEVYIPIATTDDFVLVQSDALPEDPESVISILQSETAPLGVWLDVARLYCNKGHTEQYIQILKEITGPEVEEYYENQPNACREERVIALAALAEHNVEKAEQRGTPESERKALLEDANQLLLEAETKEVQYSISVPERNIAKGKWYMARGESIHAKLEFKNAGKSGKGKLKGAIGLAYCNFVDGKHREALQLYSDIMRNLGSARCPDYVRLAMAACYGHLNNLDMAAKCYMRVLERNSASAEAHAGISSIKLASRKKRDVESGVRHLLKAYQLNPHLDFALVALCEQMLMRKDYKAVAQLANVVIRSGLLKNAKVVAEANYYLGEVYLRLNDLHKASQCFTNAKNLDETYVPPKMGLVRIQLLRGETGDILSLLAEVLKEVPNDLESLCIMSVLNKVKGEKQLAVGHAGKALALDKDNVILKEYYASLLANMDAKKALRCYRDVFNARKKEADVNQNAQVCMLNNMGVMEYQCGRYTNALNAFEECKRMLKGQQKVYSFTIAYNIARTHEAVGSMTLASSHYKKIQEQVPGYMDCTLRLAAVNHDMGYYEPAIKKCQLALKKYQNSTEALSMLIWIYLDMKEYRLANDTIKIMKERCPDEKDFVDIASGSVFLLSASKHSRTGKDGDDDKANKDIHHAMVCFKQALSHNPRNIFAAHGVSVCLAELGYVQQSKKVLDKILEARKQEGKLVDMPEVIQNRASLQLLNAQYEDAWYFYNLCQSRHFHYENAELSQLTAQALNAYGDKKKATNVLLKALHIDPTNAALKFSLAIVLKGQVASIVEAKQAGVDMSLPRLEKRVDELKYANTRLLLCKFYLNFFLSGEEGTLRGKRIQRMHQKNVILDSQLREAQKVAEEHVQRARDVEKALANQKLEKQNLAKANAQRSIAARKKIEDEDAAKLRQAQEKLKAMKENWRSGRAKSSSRKAKQVKKQDQDDDDAMDVEADPGSVWNIAGEDEKEASSGGEESDGDDGNDVADDAPENVSPKKKRKLNKAIGSDDEGDEAGEGAAEKRPKLAFDDFDSDED